jgi:hypothetical protein
MASFSMVTRVYALTSPSRDRAGIFLDRKLFSIYLSDVLIVVLAVPAT